MKALTLSLFVFGGFTQASQGDLLLRRELKEGSVENYKIAMTVNSSTEMPGGLGTQDLTIKSVMSYRLNLGKVGSDGTVVVQTTSKIEDIQAEGMMAGMIPKETQDPVTIKGTLDKLGRLKFLNSPKQDPASSMLGGSQSSFLSTFVELPEKAVKIGDSWKIEIPKGGMVKTPQFLTATLTGESEHEGHQVWVVKVSGKLVLKMDPTAMPKENGGQPNPLAGKKMSMSADVEISADGMVDKTTGQTVQYKTKSKTAQKVQIPDANLDIASTMDSEVLVSLVKDGA